MRNCTADLPRHPNECCSLTVQEIAPFLRVLGCYPMDLDAGDGQESALAERQLSSNGASGPAESTTAEDALLLSGAAFPRRTGSQVWTQAIAAILLLNGH